MKFCIITHTPHWEKDHNLFAYGPYIREMNLWAKHVDKFIIVAPIRKGEPRPIDMVYEGINIRLIRVPEFDLTTTKNKLLTLFFFPIIFFQCLRAMLMSDHIHLRCPGNMGVVGCIAQLFVPWKKKTVKYAGNWDMQSTQPWTYRVQQFIVNSTTLTHNTKVLVYGEWPNTSSNIYPFFTASYLEKDKIDTPILSLEDDVLKFVFVGSLGWGKRPMLSVQTIHELKKLGINSRLDLFGEGADRKELESYIKKHQLEKEIILHGNVDQERIKKAFQEAHFQIFMSRSEGWPKAIAESLWWGCCPLTTAVSCVPWMLNYGERGLIVKPEVKDILGALSDVIKLRLSKCSENEKKEIQSRYYNRVKAGMSWSRQYTLNLFEEKIGELL